MDQGNFGKMMMQGMKGMQDKMSKLVVDQEKMNFEGVAGSGSVTVLINGTGRINSVDIKLKDILDDSEEEDEVNSTKEILEDLVKCAYNRALDKMQENQGEQMKGLTGGSGGGNNDLLSDMLSKLGNI